MRKKSLRIVFWILVSLIAIFVLIAGSYIINNITFFERAMTAVQRAGFVEKQVTIEGDMLNYAEGPDNGPPLLLIHGQATDWKNYARVLPGLAPHYHIFAVDCYGHGGSARAPEKYSNTAMGADLAIFIQEVIGSPVVVSGHSSGGLLAAWLAANHPDLVLGVVLEDPPFFTTILPRAEKTWNYVDLATGAHNFLVSGEEDFVAYAAENSKFMAFFGDLQPIIIQDMLEARASHPDEPVVLFYLPPVLNEVFRGLNSYDPRFGEAFFTGSWDQGFDHAAALSSISAPTVLIHTNWSYNDDGILMAAMDDQDAARARSLLENVEFYQVDSGHGFHFEKPRDFIQIMIDFLERIKD